MERIIAKQIYVHLLDLLSSAQHGFVRGRSTCTNLFDAVNDWTLTVQNKKAVTIAYIDFSCVFDTVSHNKLLLRLYSYGIRGVLLEWIKQPHTPNKGWRLSIIFCRVAERSGTRQWNWARVVSHLH